MFGLIQCIFKNTKQYRQYRCNSTVKYSSAGYDHVKRKYWEYHAGMA